MQQAADTPSGTRKSRAVMSHDTRRTLEEENKRKAELVTPGLQF
jgi:hypothetical protein